MKKISAFLLAALMVAALLPTMSFATETTVNTAAELKAALDTARSGDVIVLGCDMAPLESDLYAGTWVGPLIPAGVTLDGAGHTFTVEDVGHYSSMAVFYGTGYEIKNLTIVQNGGYADRGLNIVDGKLTNVTVKGDFSMSVLASGTTEITGCTFEAADWAIWSNDTSSSMIISGCTFKGNRAAQLYGDDTFTGNTVEAAKGVSVWETSSAKLSDNTFTGGRAVSNYSTDMTFTGNNLTSETKFESTVNVTLAGNYWGQAGGPSASQLSGNAGTVTDSAPLASDPTVPVAPAYAGPVMNWVKVNAADNGVVKSGPLAASAGATVTLYPKAAEGYVLDTVTVLDAEGNAVALDGLKFAIPAGGVTVNATFKLAE